MANTALSRHPFKHVRGYDCEERFRGVVEHNLKTTFEAADLTKLDPASYPIKLRDDCNVPFGNNVHVNQCLDCRNASTASLEPVNYESYEEDVKRAAEIVAAISKHYTVTFLVSSLSIRESWPFRRCFPAASIAVI